jgi:homocysteine S-methyltransferase
VIRRTGAVLDGTPLGQAVSQIDADATRPPIGFSLNCVHAQVLETALEAVTATHPSACQRLLAFQANTAGTKVEELDGSEELVTEPAGIFASRAGQLRGRFGIRVLGGCCGTDRRHMEALARRLACETVTT